MRNAHWLAYHPPANGRIMLAPMINKIAASQITLGVLWLSDFKTENPKEVEQIWSVQVPDEVFKTVQCFDFVTTSKPHWPT